MKCTRLSLLLVAAVPFAAAQQSGTNSSWNVEDPDDDYGRSIDTRIERFLEKVSRGVTSGDFEDLFASDTIDRKPKRSIRTADLENDAFAHSYSGHTVIEADERVKGNVVVKGGDLEVYGTVEGDVLIVGGTLYVKDDGRITGNARVINGSIVKSDGGTIEGYEDKSSSAASYRERRNGFRRFGTSFDVPWTDYDDQLENVVLRYNRVEGIFLGLGSEKKYYWDGRRSWTGFGSAGWGFKSHTWRYNAGLARQISLSSEGTHLLELGVEGYSLTDSKDKWIISTKENSAAAFFIHEDFLDYFSRRGGTGHIAWYTQGSLLRTEMRVGYVADRYDSLSMRTDWALFGGNKVFRPNPPIQPGKMRSIVASAGLSTFEKTSHGPEGWAVYLTSELGRGTTGSDFSFNQHTADIRRYQPLSRYDNLNLRLRVGTSEGVLPLQKLYEIGGLGTLHAYRYKSFAGNRMILFNAEYILDGDFIDEIDFWPAHVLSIFNFVFLSDAGLVRSVAPTASAQDGFQHIRFDEFSHNFGFGISSRSGAFRLAYTWRTDISAPGVIIFRFVRPF
jgi:hypothetical protein